MALRRGDSGSSLLARASSLSSGRRRHTLAVVASALRRPDRGPPATSATAPPHSPGRLPPNPCPTGSCQPASSAGSRWERHPLRSASGGRSRAHLLTRKQPALARRGVCRSLRDSTADLAIEQRDEGVPLPSATEHRPLRSCSTMRGVPFPRATAHLRSPTFPPCTSTSTFPSALGGVPTATSPSR